MAYERAGGIAKLGPALRKYLEKVSTSTAPAPALLAVLTQEEASALRGEQRAEKTKIVEKHRAEVLLADDVAIELAKKVREPSSVEEALAVEKAYHRDFYGDVTPETLAFDAEGKGRKKAKAFVGLKLATTGEAQLLLARDADAIRSGITAAHLKHTYLEAMGIFAVLSWFGVGKLVPGTRIDPKRAAEAVQKALAHRAAMEVLGIVLRKDAAENPVQLLTSVLKKVGLSLKSKAKKIDGKVRRIYWLDGDSVAEMTTFSAHHEDRVRRGKGDHEVDVVGDVMAGLISERAAEGLMAELAAA